MSTGFPHQQKVMLQLETYTGGIVETNGHLLRMPRFNLLVDAPQGVARWLESQNVKVDALFLTHQHFDHVMDASAVKEGHACPVYAWTEFDRDLTLEKFFGAMAGSAFSVPEFAVDHVLKDQTEVTVGDQVWKLQHIPGHSPDSLCFWLGAENLLFSGDVIFSGSLGRSDFPGGSHQQLVTGIREKLWSLPAETQVFPGHGPDTTLGEERRSNPFLQ